MEAQKTHLFRISILLSGLCLTSAAIAGGDMTYGVATRAQNMGDAFTAVADDPSAVFYNPAGLTQIDGEELQLNSFLIIPKSSYTNSTNNSESTNYQIAPGGSAFYSKQLSQRAYFGLGFYAPAARTTDYSSSPGLLGYPADSFIIDTQLTPVLAFKVTDKLSIGGGPTLNYNYINADGLGLRQKGDDVSFSGVLSALYKITKTWKVGVTYHLADSVNASGTGKGNLLGMLPIDNDVHIQYKNPAYLNVGTAWQATPKLLLSIGGEIEYWSQAPTIKFTYANPAFDNTTNFNPSNSFDLHSGLEYKFKPNQAFRLGYQYYQMAYDKDAILPTVLDFNTNVYEVGYSYYHNKWRFDAGYEYARGNDVTSTSTQFNPFVGKYKLYSNTVFVGVNYKLA